jgi:predicted RNase H-like HicB family nuclease
MSTVSLPEVEVKTLPTLPPAPATAVTPLLEWVATTESPDLMRRLTLKLDAEEKGYSAQCIEFPEAISEGDDFESTIKNIVEALSLVLEERGEYSAFQAHILPQLDKP